MGASHYASMAACRTPIALRIASRSLSASTAACALSLSTTPRINASGKDWTDKYREIDIEDADGFFRAVFQNVLEVLGRTTTTPCAS